MKAPQVLLLLIPAAVVLGIALALLSDEIDNWSNRRKIVAIVLTIIFLTVAAIIAVVLETSQKVSSAGGTKGAPITHRVAAHAPAASSPIITASKVAEGGGVSPNQGRNETGTVIVSTAPSAFLASATRPLAGHGGTDFWTNHDWSYQYLEEQKKAQERGDMIARIDGYLANRGSPMQGLGWAFYDSAARFGIDPRLSVAIAEGESSCGLACCAPFNAWGMLAYRHGFASWVDGINANNDWLHNYFGSPQSAYECPGYCVPDHPWMENVDRVRGSI